MTPARYFDLFPRTGSDDSGSRSQTEETSAWASDTRRSAAIAPELSRSAPRLTMANSASAIDSRHVKNATKPHPFDLVADSGPATMFVEALAVGVLIAGIAISTAILIGVL